MKVIVNESRINELITKFLIKKLGTFIPPDKRGHPHYGGGFWESPDDETPMAYFNGNSLYFDAGLYKNTLNIFSLDEKYPLSNRIIEAINFIGGYDKDLEIKRIILRHEN